MGIKRWAAIAVLATTGCARSPAPVANLSACLSSGPGAQVDYRGTGFDRLESVFDGYGCNALAEQSGRSGIRLRPQAASRTDETHAGLVLGPEAGNRLEFACGQTTLAQLRTGSEPNAHEVGWLLWHYVDNDHFYYLMAKPNGWELGKRDPSYPGGQRFLATGPVPAIPIGQRCELRISQNGDEVEAFVDGASIAKFKDEERPYRGGRVGVYCEDADVFFDSLSVR